MANELGKTIKEIREVKGIDQESLGASMGMTRAAVSNYESGKREVPTEKIKCIARHLGVNELDLLELRIREQISATIADFKDSQ